MKELYLLSMVVSLSIVGCSGHTTKISPTINPNASLVGDLPANSLQWKVVTSAVNTEDSTMSTLYGNDLAAGYARTNSRHNYPNGSVLSLVTWTQRDDDRWFGARIPDQVKSVEFVFVGVAADGRPLYSYQEYEGKPLKRVTAQEGRTLNDRGHIFFLSEQLSCHDGADGTLAIGLIEGPSSHRDVGEEPVVADEIVVVVPSKREWVGKQVEAQQLCKAPVILREKGSGTRRSGS